ncbi:hypothetical protein FJZ26_01745 [Candidatus Parvarchaeota archaeon]|nr:hypothetical protein [Candidatus Parvarchaeota archaeon]
MPRNAVQIKKNRRKRDGKSPMRMSPSAQSGAHLGEDATYGIFGMRVSKRVVLLNISVMALFLLAVAYFALLSKSEPVLYISGERIGKNSMLQLIDGEKYSYLVDDSQNKGLVDYEVKRQGGCMQVKYGVGQLAYSLCFAKDGLVSGPGTGQGAVAQNQLSVQMAKSDLGVPNMLFRPWMLALEPGFEWSANISYGTRLESPLFANEYLTQETSSVKVIGVEDRFGRAAYKVSVVGSSPDKGQSKVTMWVDQKKRIILEAVGEGYSMKIAKAPFNITGS